MRRNVLAVVAAGLLLLVAAAPAAATTAKIATEGTEVVTGVVPGTPSFDPLTGVYSVRGEIHYGINTTTAHWPGADVVTVGQQTGDFNYDVSIVTGVGTFWGSIDLVFAPGTGFRCTYEGTIPAGTGHSVCHGYGDLEGMQSRGDFWTTETGTASTGYLFSPANK